ncbi:hypothetical protein MUK42_33082 [Musa troglodytarum]|uniref:Uncharacterized protein n=1 Tax=Musa troglodytarum TaxID=320322 RepID=A0A9E7FC87_9LILI|nr:hypothetical protein MUK42_33082 [Musa troglodytarum]
MDGLDVKLDLSPARTAMVELDPLILVGPISADAMQMGVFKGIAVSDDRSSTGVGGDSSGGDFVELASRLQESALLGSVAASYRNGRSAQIDEQRHGFQS